MGAKHGMYTSTPILNDCIAADHHQAPHRHPSPSVLGESPLLKSDVEFTTHERLAYLKAYLELPVPLVTIVVRRNLLLVSDES